MRMDKRAIRRIAGQRGLGTKFLSKDVFLSRILESLQDILDGRCVLKGGTAIVRGGHLDSPRFSEDLDIDVHTSDPKRKIADEFKELLSEVEPFDVDPPRVHRMFIRFDARYRNHFDEKDRIKLEIAPQDPRHLDITDPVPTRLTSPFTDQGTAELLTYSREDLFAMKVVALSGRQNGKDPFDIRGMWRKGLDENAALVKLNRLANLDDVDARAIIDDALDSMEWMSENKVAIVNIASHYIPRSDRPDWGSLLHDVGTIIRRLEGGLP